MRYTKLLKQNRSWLLLVVLVTALSTLIVFTPSLQAAAPKAADPLTLEQRQVFNDDLRVRSDEAIEGDVVVYQGDVTIDGGGAIRGNLIVYSGDIEVKQGGVVDGDITAFSGDIQIGGAVQGSITALSGDVKLEDSAVVSGDISVVSGEIKQNRGAVVEGSVLRGPSIKLNLPPMPELGVLPGVAPAAPIPPSPPSATQLFLSFLARVLRALLMLALAAGVGVALLAWRPRWVEETRALLVERTPLAFAAGLIFNLFGTALIGILWITVCFRPPAILLGLIFAAVNLAGIAVIGDEIGLRIAQRLGDRWTQPWRTIVGIVAPGSVIAFLWILGGCFGFFAYMGALVLTSFGVGAILVKFLKLGEPSAPETATAPAAAPSAERSQTVAPAVSEPAPAESEAAEPTVQESETQAPETTIAASEAPSVPAAAPTAPRTAVPDDFTRITGVGPVFDQRLKAAGILTFADLAARTPAEIAAAVQWSETRVERSQIIEQAQRLAQGDI